MNTGFAQNVRMLLADRSRLAANAARRLGGNRTELTRGVYSPCDLCKENPSAPPAWQFKAREIAHDRELKLLEFRDATLELDGWPVFYTPYISTPDPSVKRASGFLMPGIGNSSNNGFHLSMPYYWAIDVDKDLTLAPRFMTKGGQLLATEYRQRFGNGALSAIGSINYSDAQSATDTQASDRWRGHINATGVWDLNETLPQRVRPAARIRPDLSAALRVRAAAERDDQPRLPARLRAARNDRCLCLCVSAAAAGSRQLRRSRSCSPSPTALGSANPIRSAGGGFSTAIC